jgi:CheY-like chemotaxis protein
VAAGQDSAASGEQGGSAAPARRRRVLDVGQCPPDHFALRRLVEGFGAEVVQAHGLSDTVAQLRAGPFDLVLINRKLDRDYSDGLEILKHLKRDPATRATPVILVSNYA